MQNRILKSLFNKDWFTSSDKLHYDLQLLQVADLYKTCIMKFVFKCIHGVVPDVFLDHYKCVNENHNHRTRQAMMLHVPRTRIKMGEKNSKVNGAKLFNSLPTEITESVTLKSFSKRLKTMFVSGYT